MKTLLLWSIQIYWLIPKKWRRRCIFKESCSLFVYRKTKNDGFFGGMKALSQRYKQCRPHYSLYQTDDTKEWVILNDNSVIDRTITTL